MFASTLRATSATAAMRSALVRSAVARIPANAVYSQRTMATAAEEHKKGTSGLGNYAGAAAMAVALAASALAVEGFTRDRKTIHAAKATTPGKKPLFSSDEYTVVFVLGGPGAGKGTQSERLVKDFGFVHLSAGDLLRAERERPGSEYGDLINNYIKEGKIVPMQITINLLKNAMLASKSKNFLIDGFPRALDQGMAFEDEVCKAKFVLFFECPEGEMEKRLLKRGESSGRVDDNIESIRKRFKTFVETSMPVIDHYGGQGKVRTVSCLQSVDKVYKQVHEMVSKELPKPKAH